MTGGAELTVGQDGLGTLLDETSGTVVLESDEGGEIELVPTESGGLVARVPGGGVLLSDDEGLITLSEGEGKVRDRFINSRRNPPA